MNIRKSHKKDLERIAAIGSVPELMTAEGTHIPKHFYEQHIDSELFFVAEEDKNIVGFILGEGLRGNVVLLHFLAVEPSQRGKGIGTMLVKKFEQSFKALGYKHVFFYGPTFNDASIKFYEKHGFAKGKAYYAFSKDYF